MSKLDDWILAQAENYDIPCKPKINGYHYEIPIYNCEYCEECNCDYWLEYNA
ncbi:MAG: hypothetical protein LUH11_04145 [Candidatus Gastranaerophilales bacterium]|nr:hypothetical protein [Candidatus Gastranaerophilales bacterium]